MLLHTTEQLHAGTAPEDHIPAPPGAPAVLPAASLPWPSRSSSLLPTLFASCCSVFPRAVSRPGSRPAHLDKRQQAGSETSPPSRTAHARSRAAALGLLPGSGKGRETQQRGGQSRPVRFHPSAPRAGRLERRRTRGKPKAAREYSTGGAQGLVSIVIMPGPGFICRAAYPAWIKCGKTLKKKG